MCWCGACVPHWELSLITSHLPSNIYFGDARPIEKQGTRPQQQGPPPLYYMTCDLSLNTKFILHLRCLISMFQGSACLQLYCLVLALLVYTATSNFTWVWGALNAGHHACKASALLPVDSGEALKPNSLLGKVISHSLFFHWEDTRCFLKG